MTIQPIETFYKGYRFRSRLEARWAVFFDALGMKYVYEPEGFKLSDDTLYLPDFYLPESRQFFEVKGIMGTLDMHKIEMLIKESGRPVNIGWSDMTFNACDAWGDDSFSLADKCESVLARCYGCGKLYFVGTVGSYACQCCGWYDGDSTFSTYAKGDGDPYWLAESVADALTKAKSARFEHGENG